MFWDVMKRAGLILIGRFRSGANAEADASYGAVAIEDTTRELMALAQLRLRDIAGAVDIDAAADTSGRILVKPVGSNNAAFAQSGVQDLRTVLVGGTDNKLRQDATTDVLVTSKPGALIAAGRLWLAEISNPGEGTLYTNGTGGRVEIEQIIIANNGLANMIVLSIGAAAAGTRIFVSTVGAGSTVVLEGPIYVANGETIRGTAALAGATCSGYGYQVSV